MQASLKKLIGKFQGKKVLVIGDLMLDEHIWSKVSRISPEAPVPVADVTSITHVPGGCGNVAANIASLGGEPLLIGIIGEDSSGTKLVRALHKNSIKSDNLVTIAERPTILKSRIIAVSQQMVRVDREDRTPLPSSTEGRVVSMIRKLIAQADAVIISDYGKGLVTKKVCKTAIGLAKKLGKPVLIDPKGRDYSKYRGTTLITPNLLEAEVATGIKVADEASLIRVGKKLLSSVRSEYVIVTRGKDGMSVFSKKGNISHIPAIPREVFDITGAGDTVISTIALSLSAGAPIETAAVLSNYAASIKVGKIGTVPVEAEELRELLEAPSHTDGKIQNLKTLKKTIESLRAKGLKIVFTNGCFDIIHAGHIRYLKEAKNQGDILVIGLNSDSSVRAIKGPTRPLVPEKERAEILSALEFVDYITIFGEKTPNALISELKPDVHVKGGDYKEKDLPEAGIVKGYGGKVVIVRKIPGRSTTNIIDKMIERRKI